MRGFVFAFLVSLCFGISNGQTVETSSGTVLGSTADQSIPLGRPFTSFHGIPFGEDMSGEKRFTPSKNYAAPWEGVLDVTSPTREFEYRCVQRETETEFIGQENCLVLTVYTHQVPSDQSKVDLRPVLVFFHGGGFILGGSDPYLPNRIMNEDVVLVEPHYRMGAFGFLTTHSQGAPGNGAIYDGILALKWIQDNIANFGGDPNRVTVSGQSAGAALTNHIMISPLSRGLLHAAILQSGTSLATWAVEEDPKPYEFNERIGNLLGCTWNPFLKEAYLDCMRNVDSLDLVKTQTFLELNDLSNGDRLIALRGCGPVAQRYGGLFRALPAHPKKMLAEGRFNKVPTMIGTTKTDGSIFLASIEHHFMKPNNLTEPGTFNADEFAGYSAKSFEWINSNANVQQGGSGFADYFLARTSRETYSDIIPGMTDMFGTLLFHFDAYQTASIISSYGVPVYAYSFDYVGFRSFFPFLILSATEVEGGVAHADDVLLYEFAWPFGISDTDDIAFSKQFVSLLTNMTIFKNPTPDGSAVQWSTFSLLTGMKYMSIDQELKMKANFPDKFTVVVDEFLADS